MNNKDKVQVSVKLRWEGMEQNMIEEYLGGLKDSVIVFHKDTSKCTSIPYSLLITK